jgi:hypothetical protein
MQQNRWSAPINRWSSAELHRWVFWPDYPASQHQGSSLRPPARSSFGHGSTGAAILQQPAGRTRPLRPSAAPAAGRPAGGSLRPDSGGAHQGVFRNGSLPFGGPAGHRLGRHVQRNDSQEAGGHAAACRTNRTIMQIDPAARHSLIGSFKRTCYVVSAPATTAQILHSTADLLAARSCATSQDGAGTSTG